MQGVMRLRYWCLLASATALAQTEAEANGAYWNLGEGAVDRLVANYVVITEKDMGLSGWLSDSTGRQYNTLHADTRVIREGQDLVLLAGDEGLVRVRARLINQSGYTLLRVTFNNRSPHTIERYMIHFFQLGAHGWKFWEGAVGPANNVAVMRYAERGSHRLFVGGLPSPDGWGPTLRFNEDGLNLINWTADAGGALPPQSVRTLDIVIDSGKRNLDLREGERAVTEAFAALHPQQDLALDEKRPWQPVGSLFLPFQNLSDGGIGASLGGPRQWSSAYEKELIRWLDVMGATAVKNAQKYDMFGVIVWDTDGRVLTHPQLYVGPADDLHPLLDKHIDRLFQRIQKAGLRTGILVRVNRARYDYEAGRLRRWDENPQWKGLERVMLKAEARWGCDIFYLDSLGADNWPIVRELQRRHPHWLIIPENATPHTPIWADSAPYLRPAHRDWEMGAHALTRDIWPEAVSFIDPEGLNWQDLPTLRQSLLPALRRGDRLILQTWWPNPTNEVMADLLEEAYPLWWRKRVK